MSPGTQIINQENRSTQQAISAGRQCLTHQLPEDQTSLVGLVCPRCKQRLYTGPPKSDCRVLWESQPAAYLLNGEPCFVRRLIWDNFEIRSLQFGGGQAVGVITTRLDEWTEHGPPL